MQSPPPSMIYGWVKMELKIALLLTLREDICEPMSRGGGGGGWVQSTSSIRGGFAPRSNPLFERNGISYVHLLLKNGTPLTCLF